MITAKSCVQVLLCPRVTKVLHLVSTTIALCFVCLPLLAQTNQGRIQGAVFDQSGGVIAGATVTVTDVARGIARPLTTDSAGEYSASSLLPGTYTVRAETKGFRATEHTGILVQVGEDIRVDLTLQPGEQTETLTVTAGSFPEMETTNATLGGAISNETIGNLPLNGRDFTNLLTLRPGVILYPGGGNFSTAPNGNRPDSVLFLLDGVLNLDPMSGGALFNFQFQAGGASTTLTVDAIQEFSVHENPKAEYGWAMGAVTNIGLKSGTNSLHGTAYAYGRDDGLDARNFFDPTTLTNGAPNPKTPVQLEQFGGTAGGPIIKDKLFWFVSYEGQRYTVGNLYVSSAPVSVSIGDPASSLVDACNVVKRVNVTPLSALLAGLPAGSCIPQPASSTFENLFPFNAGNNPSGPTSITPVLPNINTEDSGVAKIDYHINDHHALSGSFFLGNLDSLWVTAPDQLEQRWQNILRVQVPTYGGHWTWTPNSRWVNELRAGYGQTHEVNLSNDGTVNPAAAWPTGYGLNTGVTNPVYFGFPYFQIDSLNNFSLGHGHHTADEHSGSFDLVDNISYLRGRHSFKFGGEFIYARIRDFGYGDTEGRIRFRTLQDFLLGIPHDGRVVVGNPLLQGRDGLFAGFFQDDWRATKTLTLNFGLRYEYAMPPWELNNLYSNFLPNLGLVLANGPSLVKNDYREFSPRAGLAWDVTGSGKTVVHAGFSILYPTAVFPYQAEVVSTPLGADIVVNGVTTPGSQLGSFEIDYDGSQLQSSWQHNSPAVPLYPIASPRLQCGDGVGADPGPCATQAVDPNIRVSHDLNWNLDIQRAITNNLTLDVAYVGNHGSGLNAQIQLNEPPIGAGWFGPHNAAAACLASAPTYDNCRASNADETAARPFQKQFPYLEFIDQSKNLYVSNYNGLQVTLTERSYHGLYFLAGYTFAHALDDISAVGPNNFKPIDSARPQLEYGSSDFDIKHHFTLSLTYALPGKKSPGQILEGWKVDAIVTLQSGLPWSVQDVSDDFVGTGGFRDLARARWDFTGKPSDFTSGPNPIPCFGPGTGCNPTIPAVCMSAAQANGPLAVASLVNLGCFVQGSGVMTPPAYGSIGNMARNIFRDGGLKNLDFSVVKEWKFKERLTTDFRADFFNVLNHPNFSNPYGARSGYDNNNPAGGLGFGCGCLTPDAATGNFVLGSGGARDIQLGLKFIF